MIAQSYMSPVSPLFHTVESVRLPFQSKMYYLRENLKLGKLEVRIRVNLIHSQISYIYLIAILINKEIDLTGVWTWVHLNIIRLHSRCSNPYAWRAENRHLGSCSIKPSVTYSLKSVCELSFYLQRFAFLLILK